MKFRFVLPVQLEYWGQYGTDLTLTYPGDGSGVLLDIGFALDAVASSQAVSMRLGSFYWGSHSFNDSQSCSPGGLPAHVGHDAVSVPGDHQAPQVHLLPL